MCQRGVTRAGRARGTVTAQSSCARRCGGALVSCSVVVGRQQGAAGELTGATGRAPGKVGAGGAHRGHRSMVRWRKLLRAVVFTSGREAPVIGGGRLGLLQYRRKKARVRRGSIGARSRAGMGHTDEGKTDGDDGPRNGEGAVTSADPRPRGRGRCARCG
jgi:hypothetical protein